MSAPARGPDSAPLLRPNAFLASALRQVDLPEAGAAIDVGCGSGRDAVFLAQTLGDMWETTGVDNHKGALGAGAAINLADSDGYSPLLLSGHFGREFCSTLERERLPLQAQRMSVALQLAAAEEIATELRLAAASEDAAVA